MESVLVIESEIRIQAIPCFPHCLLHANSIFHKVEDEVLVDSFSSILKSDYISEQNQSLDETFRNSIIDFALRNRSKYGRIVWIEDYTGPSINLVTSAIKNEMDSIQKLIK